jgi:16S rRNA (guanine966-N2)-methyltransferase
VRVVSGEARGIRLGTPTGRDVRPTGDRVREATFNALGSMGVIDGAQVVDLFAGTGAMGIEALSRGSAHATFVDSAHVSVELIRGNLEATGFSDRATVVRGDVIDWARAADTAAFDVSVADPPYDFDRWSELLASIESAVIVIESDREIEIAAGYELRRTRRYGGTVVSIALRQESAT